MVTSLKFLHDDSRKIIHRDIKPANFMISETEDGSLLVCLGDFGLSVEDEEKVTKPKSARKSAPPRLDQTTGRASTSRYQRVVEGANERREQRRRHRAGDAANDGEGNERRHVDARRGTNNPVKEPPKQRTKAEKGTRYFKAPEIVSFLGRLLRIIKKIKQNMY